MARSRFLELWKFSVYLAVPACLTYAVVASPDALDLIVQSKSYVVYPPEGPKPPTAEEIQQLVNKAKAQK